MLSNLFMCRRVMFQNPSGIVNDLCGIAWEWSQTPQENFWASEREFGGGKWERGTLTFIMMLSSE